MTDLYVFADEAGNFDFSRQVGASRFFILCTVTSTHCQIGDALLSLRRDLGWRGLHLDRVFHATEDPQPVRDEVFALLGEMDCRVDATILEKSKAQARKKRATHSMRPSTKSSFSFRRAALIGSRFGLPRAIRAFRSPTTARGPFSASGSAETSDPTS